MGTMMILPDIEWLLPEIDQAIETNDTQALVDILPGKVVDAFRHTTEMRDKPAWAATAEHLASLFAPADGVDREIYFFNQYRPSRTTTGTEICAPAAQRDNDSTRQSSGCASCMPTKASPKSAKATSAARWPLPA